MKTRMTIIGAAVLAAVVSAVRPAAAQSADAAPEHRAAIDSLTACVAAAEAKHQPEAFAAADGASKGFDAGGRTRRPQPARRPGSQVLLQCRLPFASFMEQGALSARASEILRTALELDPTHWDARYTLAINYFYNPEFMGLTDDAIQEFET